MSLKESFDSVDHSIYAADTVRMLKSFCNDSVQASIDYGGRPARLSDDNIFCHMNSSCSSYTKYYSGCKGNLQSIRRYFTKKRLENLMK